MKSIIFLFALMTFPCIIFAQLDNDFKRRKVDSLFMSGNYKEIPNCTFDSLEVIISKTFAYKEKDFDQEIFYHLSALCKNEVGMYHIWSSNSLV